MLKDKRGTRVLFWVLAAFLGLCLFEWITIIKLNHGFFTYSLDDPYIHLAMAENLAKFHYGVNLQEWSSPSSSFLWLLLLLPFAFTSILSFAPLILNTLISVASIIIFGKIFRCCYGVGNGFSNVLYGLFLILFILACNLTGLLFMGMEHSLHVMLCALVMLGIIIEFQEDKLPRWFDVALILLGLVRYEALSLVVGIWGILLWRGYYRRSLIQMLILIALLGGYSFYLYQQDAALLPSSVLAKARHVGFWQRLQAGFMTTIFSTYEPTKLSFYMIAFLPVVIIKRFSSRQLALAVVGIMVILGHFLFGHYIPLGRYTAYLNAIALAGLCYCYLPWVAENHQQLRQLGLIFSALSVYVFFCASQFIEGIAGTPMAAHNIYQQHYQMHRFVTEFYPAPVAANDIGWLTYQNNHYVLDLLGLANPRARRERFALRSDANALKNIVQDYHVPLVMIYTFPGMWRQLPDWDLLGVLTFAGPVVSAASNSVYFYTPDKERGLDIKKKLVAFKETLPPGVHLAIN